MLKAAHAPCPDACYQVDVVDCIGLLSLALYVLSGQMMSMMDNEKESMITAWALMVITAATLATIIVIFWNEHKQLQVK